MDKRLNFIFSCAVAFFCLAFGVGNTVSGQDSDGFVVFRNSYHRTVTPSSMSSYTVTAMAQDDRGLIWLGTVNGLFYFDNYNFTSYECDESINAMITSLLCVGDSLFVGTESGLTIVNIEDCKVSDMFAGSKINTMQNTISNFVMIGTDSGLFELNRKDKKVSMIYDNPLCVNDIVFDEYRNQWWIATADGVFVKSDGDIRKFNDVKVSDICVFDRNHVFFGTENGLYKAEDETDSLCLIGFEITGRGMITPDITNVIDFDEDEILVGTNGNGVFRFNVNDGSTINITRYGSANLSLSDDYVTKLFKDDSERYWIATALGINSMVKNNSSFTSFSLYNGSTHNLPVRSIAQAGENELFMGTDDGVFVFNRTKNSYNSFEDYYNLDDSRMASARVGKVFYDRDRYLWVGTRYRGVFCFDTWNRVFLEWLPDFSRQIINDICNDNHGGIWLATSSGVSKINIKEKMSERMFNGYSRGLLCDGDFMYITVDKGLLRYSILDGSREVFEVDDNNVLYNITKGNDGKLYIGSYHNGVVTFDAGTRTFGVFKNAKDGVSPIAYSVVFDNEDNAWVASNVGIWTYNKATRAISIYNVSDGLQGNDFTMNGAMRGNYGMMYFGGFNGFTMFNPLNISQEKTEPKLMVYNVHTSLGNDMMNIRNNDTLRLKFEENSFIINFSAYNLFKINKIKYRYKLDGYDKQWTDTGSTVHGAEYRNLPAGTYTFILIASNEANIQNSVPFHLTIVVKPKWYGTIYFKVVAALAVLLLVFLLIYGKIRKERRKIAHAREINELERKMFQLKGQALQLQMNPHFLYNTLNSIQSFILTNDTIKASMYLSSFAKLMRKVLNNASREKILLSEELESIRLYLDLEKLRLNERFDYKVIVDDNIQLNKVEIASMLLQPFAENAVIHGLAYKAADGMLKIEVRKVSAGSILFVIEDNGIGRVKAAQIRKELGKTEKSHATSITRQRLEILNEVSKGEYSVKINDLYDADGNACGTKVEIIMCCDD
ncbi:MAG: histidine kinase [Bacteroidales bacterium]|nr:histidine kinase [Bacteroidales bacterium]